MVGGKKECQTKAEELLSTMISSCLSTSDYRSIYLAADSNINQYHPLQATSKLLPAWKYTYPEATQTRQMALSSKTEVQYHPPTLTVAFLTQVFLDPSSPSRRKLFA